jgi:hypothetical protein
MRMPVVSQFIQVITDASGGGPRRIGARAPEGGQHGRAGFSHSSPDQSLLDRENHELM